MFDGAIVQNAYVVDDLDRAIDQWVENLGAGPFFVNRELALEVSYRGRKAPLDIGIALGQAGAVQIELIQVNRAGDNVYSDVYPNGVTCGFHHIAIFPRDLERAIETYTARDYPVAMELMFGNTRVLYMDTRSDMGCMIEFYEDTAELRGLYDMVAAAARDWNGKDRIRPLA